MSQIDNLTREQESSADPSIRIWPPDSFHVLIKPTGAICNLDCKYCFFLSKEELYPGSKFRMTDDVLETYVRQLVESQHSHEVTLAWQGGEPTLMNLDFFKRSVELADKYRRPDQTVTHTLQTNGTRLNDEWCEFFREHNFLIGLSIDGFQELHDVYRVDKGGRGTFDKVRHAWDLLRKHDVDVNVLCTVHAANADYPLEIYRFFRDDLGARYLQFIPIVERATESILPLANIGWHARPGEHRPLYVQSGNLVTDRTVNPEQYGRFLITIFDEWVRHDVGAVFVQMFDAALANWLGVPPGLCVFSETCGAALALEHNGDVYSCDHYVEPDYLLGNIASAELRDLIASPRQASFGLDKRASLPRYCRECEVRFACHGECPRNRFSETPDGEPGLNYLCAGYKAFFTHVDRPMRIMADLVSHGRFADEVMTVLSEEDEQLRNAAARAGRNALCPCGSGMKVKYCHGRVSSPPRT